MPLGRLPVPAPVEQRHGTTFSLRGVYLRDAITSQALDQVVLGSFAVLRMGEISGHAGSPLTFHPRSDIFHIR